MSRHAPVLNEEKQIKRDLDVRVKEFEAMGKLLEAQRIRERTTFDLEMMQATERVLALKIIALFGA